jgi:hypothetical protein
MAVRLSAPRTSSTLLPRNIIFLECIEEKVAKGEIAKLELLFEV